MNTRTLALLLLLLLSCPAWASQIDLLRYRLVDLESGQQVELSRFRGKAVVMVIFEPGCPFCVKQARILNRMLESCEGLQPLAIGVNANRRRLHEQLHNLQPQFPAFMASPQMLEDIGEVLVTPLLLISDQQGNYYLHMLGLQGEADLLRALGELLPDCEPN